MMDPPDTSEDTSQIRNESPTDDETELSQPPPLTALPSEWTLITSLKMNDTYPVSKYRCLSSGMELVHANIPGPHVSCYWIIAHKLEDEIGLPNILQHMIWHGGSKKFHVPGLFQHISDLCYCSGPKSWVERDHACYHISTAGKEGFAKLLPVVFDHLFAPLLQEASYLHEIYNVAGDGSEHGECFKKVFHLEQDPDEVSSLELIRKIFGEGSNYWHSVYGKSELLRTMETTILEKLHEFHEKFYHASNCCMVVCGDIAKEELFSLLAPFVSGPMAKKREGWIKPWLNEPIVKVHDAIMSRIPYPASIHMESLRIAAVVKLGILGPPSTEKLNRVVAMRLALEYLASGPLVDCFTRPTHRMSIANISVRSAPVTNLATNVTVSEHEFKQTLFTVECHNVPLEMISNVPHSFRRTLEAQIDDHFGEFDHNRMCKVIERFYEDELNNLENHIEEKMVHAIIPDYLYLDHESDLMFDRRVNHVYTIHHFLTQPPEFWKLVLQGILDTEWITIGAVPSSMLKENLKREENLRIEEKLSSEHIKTTKKHAQRYRAAHRLFKKRPPAQLLTYFTLPSVHSIGCTHIKRKENPRWAQDTLCNLLVDDINSSYVFLTIIMDTRELTFEEKKYLVLFAEGILNSPYLDSTDNFHTAEEMKIMMDRDCIQYETFFGLEWYGKLEDRTKFSCGSFSHLFCLRFFLDVTKVREGFRWAKNLLWNTKWQADKLRLTCMKLFREVDSELKGLGSVMTRAILTDSLYLMNSVPKCIGLVRQKSFLRRVGEELPKSMRKVSKILEGIRMTILRPENCTVHVAGSLTKMEFNLAEDPNETNTTDAIAQLFRDTFDYTGWHWGYDTRKLSNVPDTNWMRTPECIAKCAREQILRMTLTSMQIDMETPESQIGCLVQAAPGIRSWQDPDYPILLVALQYFIQPTGGPLQQEIVEAELAEEIDIRVSPSEGLIYFEMRHCSNIALAYGKAYDIIAQHCKMDEDVAAKTSKTSAGDSSGISHGPTIWNDLILSSAKSSMIFRLSLEESSPQYVAMLSLLSYYKNVPQLGTARRELMAKIANASMTQVQEVTGRYFRPLFLEPCTCAASAPKEKAIPIIKELMERCGKRLTLIPPVEQSALASYNQ